MWIGMRFLEITTTEAIPMRKLNTAESVGGGICPRAIIRSRKSSINHPPLNFSFWTLILFRKSTTAWKFVVGHHPLYSAGKRKGKTGDMLTFKPLFNKYHLDAYFAGHEHHLEYDQTNNDSFHHFISGGGSEARPVASAPYARAVFSAHGFIAVSVAETEMLAQFVDHTGKIIYSVTIKK